MAESESGTKKDKQEDRGMESVGVSEVQCMLSISVWLLVTPFGLKQ